MSSPGVPADTPAVHPRSPSTNARIRACGSALAWRRPSAARLPSCAQNTT